MRSGKLGYQKWAIAIYMVATGLKGVSSMKLRRDLKIRQPSAWHLAQRIRQGFLDGSKLEGVVEIDETYIGGKERNKKHESKKLHAGRGTVGKAAVIGGKQRDGNVVAKSIKSVDAFTLIHFASKSVKPDATVYTDDHRGYGDLRNFYHHGTVKHSVGEFVREQAHTNGIESFWALLKRGYYGTYHHMSAKHLARYVVEFSGRFNIRKVDTLDQMNFLVKEMEGKRLRYKDLVA